MDWINSATDWFRLANITLSTLYLSSVLVFGRRRLLSRTHNRADLLHQLAVAALSVAILVGSVETLAADAPAPGVRTYFFTLGLAWAYLAEWTRWRDKHKNPPNKEGTHHHERE